MTAQLYALKMDRFSKYFSLWRQNTFVEIAFQ